MEILIGESRSNHFPLACTLSFCNDKDVKPKVRAKLLVTNAPLFKDQQFKDLVAKATKELEGRVSQAHHNSWGQFFKKIQGAIKLVGPIIKKKIISRMDAVNKRF